MTRVLVTGADGTIGRVVVTHLLEHGHAVTALVREPADTCPADRVVVGDARFPETVGDALDGADAVVHLAAIPHPDLGTPFEVFTSNTAATWAVLTQASARGVGRVVLASSINASGVPMNPHDVHPAAYPLDEDTPHDVADAYSHSKQTDEASAAAAGRAWGLTTVCLRFPYTAPRANLLAASREVRADPRVMSREGWAYLDVRDAAAAVEAALTAPLTGSHVVGLAADDTLLEIASADAVATWAPHTVLRRRVDGNGALVDTSRAAALLGFRPRYSVHDGA